MGLGIDWAVAAVSLLMLILAGSLVSLSTAWLEDAAIVPAMVNNAGAGGARGGSGSGAGVLVAAPPPPPPPPPQAVASREMARLAISLGMGICILGFYAGCACLDCPTYQSFAAFKKWTSGLFCRPARSFHCADCGVTYTV